jgi:hypothetical protein
LGDVFADLASVVGRRFQRVLETLQVADIVPAFRLWKLFGFYAQMTDELLMLRRPQADHTAGAGNSWSASDGVGGVEAQRTAPPSKTASADSSITSGGSSGSSGSSSTPLSTTLRGCESRAMAVFMALARQRADKMLETIPSAPASLSVASVVESSLRNLDAILRQEKSSLTSSNSSSNGGAHVGVGSSTSMSSSGNGAGEPASPTGAVDGGSTGINAVLDLFLHPLLRTALRSAKVRVSSQIVTLTVSARFMPQT